MLAVADTTDARPEARQPGAPSTSALWTGIPTPGLEELRTRAVGECMDLLGLLRSYRENKAAEHWMLPLAAERRMLAQVRAILSQGQPGIDQVLSLALDPDVPDPDRVFAATFVAGCADNSASLDRGLAVLAAAARRDTAETAAAVEALCLAPHPQLAAALEHALGDQNANLRSAAVRVLGFRSVLTPSQWFRAIADSEGSVVLSALGHPPAKLDRSDADAVLSPLYVHRLEPLAKASLRAGIGLGVKAAADAARSMAYERPGWASSLLLLAALGDPGDRALIERAMALDIDAAAHAVARAGWLTLGQRLLERVSPALSSDDHVLPRLAETLGTLTSLPPQAASSQESLAQAWNQTARSLSASNRWRHGRELALETLVDELRNGAGSRQQRQELYFEIQALTQGQAPRFSAFEFIGVQLDQLDALDAFLRGRPAFTARP
jgi:hypothetical protein